MVSSGYVDSGGSWEKKFTINEHGYKEGDLVYTIRENKIIRFFVNRIRRDGVYETTVWDSCIANETCRKTLPEAKLLLKKYLLSEIAKLEPELLEMKMMHDKLEDEVSDDELRKLGVLKE